MPPSSATSVSQQRHVTRVDDFDTNTKSAPTAYVLSLHPKKIKTHCPSQVVASQRASEPQHRPVFSSVLRLARLIIDLQLPSHIPSAMPLVKIDLVRGRRSPAQLRTLADTVQTVMLQKFKAPPRDRYQVNLPAPRTCMIQEAKLPDHNAT